MECFFYSLLDLFLSILQVEIERVLWKFTIHDFIFSGDKVRLKGFDKYKGGLDTVHDLTGTFLILKKYN